LKLKRKKQRRLRRVSEVSDETLRQILQYLWQQHQLSEQQYLYIILLSPLVALVFFIMMWTKHRAHCYTLSDALAFFFAPRGPYRMLVFKDLLGNRLLIYDYRVVKGEKGYTIQAGPYMIKTSDDPEAYAEPVSLLDARGPPGIPSPFGLWVRQLVASYIMLALIAVSFANTMWITMTVYAPAMNVPYTQIDLISFTALVLGFAWFIAVLLRALSPQTLVVSLSAIGMSEGYVEATPALDTYSSFPPAKLLKSINRAPKIDVSDSVREVFDKLKKEVGDEGLAASILALLGQVYDTWRRSLGIVLQDRYDISVAARAKYQLEESKIPKGFLAKYSGALALIAIIIAVVVLILWLQPTVTPATNQTATNTTLTYVTPAPPPPPPGG